MNNVTYPITKTFTVFNNQVTLVQVSPSHCIEVIMTDYSNNNILNYLFHEGFFNAEFLMS